MAVSAAYWIKKQKELQEAFEQQGHANIFFTFSFADLHNPVLNRLMGGKGSRVKRLNENPYTATKVFRRQIRTYVKNYLKRIPGYKWNYFRYEFQHRGSVHVHGFARIEREGS